MSPIGFEVFMCFFLAWSHSTNVDTVYVGNSFRSTLKPWETIAGWYFPGLLRWSRISSIHSMSQAQQIPFATGHGPRGLFFPGLSATGRAAGLGVAPGGLRSDSVAMAHGTFGLSHFEPFPGQVRHRKSAGFLVYTPLGGSGFSIARKRYHFLCIQGF